MYAVQHTKDGSLKHSDDCKMVFGRKDPNCPRCQELLSGAPARDGWQKGYYSQKKLDEKQRLEEIKSHDCEKSNCGPVCTFGDW